jgi:group I intron endonuclease
MGRYSKYTTEAGIYKLTCEVNDKIYIGKAVNLRRRINSHKFVSKDGYFQRAITKHGWDSFKVEILETFDNFDKLKDNNSLLERESHYIRLFDSTNVDKGYNVCKYSTDRTGIPMSTQTKEKISISKLGKVKSEETKNRMRTSRLGTQHSDETKEKIRQARLGTKHSTETKEKLKQRKHSDESKLKMRSKTLSNVHKEKIRQSMLRKKQVDGYILDLRGD